MTWGHGAAVGTVVKVSFAPEPNYSCESTLSIVGLSWEAVSACVSSSLYSVSARMYLKDVAYRGRLEFIAKEWLAVSVRSAKCQTSVANW